MNNNFSRLVYMFFCQLSIYIKYEFSVTMRELKVQVYFSLKCTLIFDELRRVQMRSPNLCIPHLTICAQWDEFV